MPPTATLLPFKAAMLRNWAQSATEMPEFVHWLRNCWPLLAVDVAAALDDVLDALVEIVLDVVATLVDAVLVETV